MNRVQHGLSGGFAPYHDWQPTVRWSSVADDVRLHPKLTKPVGTECAEKPIAAAITMITEAEEWARRALAAQGFGEP